MEFTHPFTCVVAGPTGCGKTQFVKRVIEENLIKPKPQNIVWFYDEWQDSYKQMTNVKFVHGFSLDIGSMENSLLILDDMMGSCDKRVSNLFTKGSHHRNNSIFYIVQNVFDKSKEHRTISLNAHYLIVFKNPRDSSQITHLAKQVLPSHVRSIQEAFRDATSKPHGYLMFDFKQSVPDEQRLRTNIFKGEQQFVYIPKKQL